MRRGILAAEKVLAKKKEALQLVDRHGRNRGTINAGFQNSEIEVIIDGSCFSLETIERWVKQAKAARRKQYV